MEGGTAEVHPHLRARLAGLRRRLGRPGRILDLGCGEGVFVAYARDQGWDAVGVETSAWAAGSGRRRFGIEIVERPIEGSGLPADSFDVVHANHVLEHLTDPVAAVRAAYRLLRPGGLFVAEVPQELVEPVAERIGRLLGGSAPVSLNYHLVYFSRKGLRLAVAASGLRIEQLVNLRHRSTVRRGSSFRRAAAAAVHLLERLLGRAPAYVVAARRP